MNADRSKLLAPLVVLALTAGVMAAVWQLTDRANASRVAQLQVGTMTLALVNLGHAAFNADPASGGSAAVSRAEIAANQMRLAQGLTPRSQPGVPQPLLATARASLAATEGVVQSIYATASSPGGLQGAGARVSHLTGLLSERSAGLMRVLKGIGRNDANRAARAQTQTRFGAAGAMLVLLTGFAFFYFRALSARRAVERLAKERHMLLGESQLEARTDALTQIGNRRALSGDLTDLVAEPSTDRELLLAMFDLDGFKQYNDSFGHAAGDSLLRRLGERLQDAVAKSGSAYRLGGDEFCVVARCAPDNAERVLNDALGALTDSGEGWHIGSSHGAVWVPSEAGTGADALKLADERMYANKATRSSASTQVTDALLQVITEQDVELDMHVQRVSELSAAVAEALDASDYEVWLVRLAARLHDIGKTAIPTAILSKPGPLDEKEWEYVHRHPVIGERIVTAAPALALAGPLIRSSHERIDGKGYPDKLSGEEIPIGSRIIAVCDAFDAMTSHRPYREPMDARAALDELLLHAGSQFDREVVGALCRTIVSPAGSGLLAEIS